VGLVIFDLKFEIWNLGLKLICLKSLCDRHTYQPVNFLTVFLFAVCCSLLICV